MPRVSSKYGPLPAVIPFVGRSSELESVKAYLAEAQSGHPRLVLITGDAGMGKTRLLRELRSAADPSAVVLYGHCYEDVSIPYLPFVEVVRSGRPFREAGERDVRPQTRLFTEAKDMPRQGKFFPHALASFRERR